MFARNKQGERRVSPPIYKVLLTTHIIFSGGWLGVSVTKFFLALAALASDSPAVIDARYAALEIVNYAFPPIAMGTLISGVLLSLGTKWGLLRHYWVATKLVLTVGVIGSAINLSDRWAKDAAAESLAGTAANGSFFTAMNEPANLLITLCVIHIVMLTTATILSTYKPWGRIWFARGQKAARTVTGGATATRGG